MEKVQTIEDIKVVASYLRRVGAEVRGMRTAVIREPKGKYWVDICSITISTDGIVSVSNEAYAPTEGEEAGIKTACENIQWPQIKPLYKLPKNLPKVMENADKKDIFLFRNAEGMIIFAQVRIDNAESGSKNYVPCSYFDDDEWRHVEPDGRLPLYNIDKVGDNTTVFIHEGAKAARHAQWMVDGETAEARKALKEHPWGQEIDGAVHVGWVGGALSPDRTDWSVLKRLGINRAYIVSDNDAPGRQSVPKIAYYLRMPTFTIQFTDEWPVSFDIADEFPSKMFSVEGKTRYYHGPSFSACLQPATWATDLVPNKRGRPSAVLRECFLGMWTYAEEADLFVCTEMPDIMRQENILNKKLAPFSHASNTAQLIAKAYSGQYVRLCYRPDEKGFKVENDGWAGLNLHRPTDIKPVAGDPTPWLEFMEYLFPIAEERDQMLKWCATIAARPEIKMEYGVLLVSEKQGVGKTTLGSAVLAPLVGPWNAGFPSESDIGSSFNGWIANRRLVVANEIYSGHSWRVYNILKSKITDREIEVNEKFMRPYRIENWAHIIASSNSMRALKLENDDRRWFAPYVTENLWPREKFAKFRSWLNGGGLQIIMHWAVNYGEYCKEGERAPMTARKAEMIEESLSDHQQNAIALARVIEGKGGEIAVCMKPIMKWLESQSSDKVWDTAREIRKAMCMSGLNQWDQRLRVQGSDQYVMLSKAARMNLANFDPIDCEDERERRKIEDTRKRDYVRSILVMPEDVMEGEL